MSNELIRGDTVVYSSEDEENSALLPTSKTSPRTKRGGAGSRGVKEYYFGELQQDRKMNVGEDESTTTPDAEKELLARTDEDKRSVRNGQETEKSLPYPKSIWFIVGNEFCERFSYYGMKAILTLYISEKLHYSEDTATGIYHVWSALCYFMPLFGAIIADSWLGKFTTIWIISIIYVLGHLFKTLAAIPPLGLPPAEFSFIGLALIAIGTGGIKPCVSAFGGDQFKLPEQERQLQTFFSVFYFSINAGSLISTALTPILRQDVQCFGDDTCFSLAFGIPAILMALATVILVIGKPFYTLKPPQGNIITSVAGAIALGVKGKINGLLKRGEKKAHFLDHAKGKYSDDMVEDTKGLLRILKIFIPIPIFWALFDQQGSRWTFQAVRTTGQLGSFIIKPDQMQVVNPLMILILIPIFDRFIYPQFGKIGLFKKPIQRIFVGGILTGVAFYISGFLELALKETYGIVPKHHESHMHIQNSMDCLISVNIPGLENKPGSIADFHRGIEAKGNLIIQGLEPGKEYKVVVKSGDQDPIHCRQLIQKEFSFVGKDKNTTEYVIRNVDKQITPIKIEQEAKPSKKKASDSKPSIRMLLSWDGVSTKDRVRLHGEDNSDMSFKNYSQSNEAVVTEYQKVFPQTYSIWVNDIKLQEMTLRQGGVYSMVVIKDDNGTFMLQKHLLTKENSVHMLWLIPQYIVITCGEVMLSITGLEFSYSQAPDSMKSVIQACWLLNVAFGNIIVFIVAESHFFEEQAPEFFLFGTLIFVAMLFLLWLAKGFQYVNSANYIDSPEEKEENKSEEISLEEKSSM